jgi:hypothetical protein
MPDLRDSFLRLLRDNSETLDYLDLTVCELLVF